MTAMPKTAAEVEAAVTRKQPYKCPTIGCEGMVTHINMGVCNDCFDSVVAVCRPVLIPDYTDERKVTSDHFYAKRPHLSMWFHGQHTLCAGCGAACDTLLLAMVLCEREASQL